MFIQPAHLRKSEKLIIIEPAKKKTVESIFKYVPTICTNKNARNIPECTNFFVFRLACNNQVAVTG